MKAGGANQSTVGMILPDEAKCKVDEEERSPLDIDVCPYGYDFCTGDCLEYTEE